MSQRLASTSARRLPIPCLCSHTPSSAQFSTTSFHSAESERKKSARLRKKSVLAARQAAELQARQTAPNLILGYHDASAWEQSKLKGLLVKRENVWGDTLRKGSSGRDQETLDMNAASAGEGAQGSLEDRSGFPERLNFGLDGQDAQLLFESLPGIAAQKAIMSTQSSNLSSEALRARVEQAEQLEVAKRDNLMRVVDLKNANARGVRVENTKRVVEEFSKLPDGRDTGSPEVQVAVLTLRIRNMAIHLSQAKKDHSNAKQLRALISQRAKMFRYLKKKSIERYNAALKACGIEARAVEGELIILESDVKQLAGLSI